MKCSSPTSDGKCRIRRQSASSSIQSRSNVGNFLILYFNAATDTIFVFYIFLLNIILFSSPFALFKKESLHSNCNCSLLIEPIWIQSCQWGEVLGTSQNYFISTGMTESRLAQLKIYIFFPTLTNTMSILLASLALIIQAHTDH